MVAVNFGCFRELRLGEQSYSPRCRRIALVNKDTAEQSQILMAMLPEVGALEYTCISDATRPSKIPGNELDAAVHNSKDRILTK